MVDELMSDRVVVCGPAGWGFAVRALDGFRCLV